MCGEKNIRHHFNLTGMDNGDWFLGCGRCWYQVEKRSASVRECPECGGWMKVYDVTEPDVKMVGMEVEKNLTAELDPIGMLVDDGYACFR